MSGNIPFGFGSGDPDDPNRPGNPIPPGFGQFPGGGDFDAANLGAALQQLGAMLQSSGGEQGPVNWDMALDLARKTISEAGDPSISDAQRRAVSDAVQLAEVWLDPSTEFPAAVGSKAWSRSEWLTETVEAWKKIVTPVAEQVQNSMQLMMPGPGDLGGMSLPEGLPPELAAAVGPLMGMAKAMGSAMFGMQVGQGLAALASEVVSSSDVGIPLTSDGHSALVPANVKAFGEGLGLPESDVLVYLALRESAHQRLFAHVPWLRARAEGAMEAYARGVKIDQSRIEAALADVDMQNPQALQDAMASGVFEPEDTEEQKAALARLETLLALIEGWVDDVVDAAAADRLPSYGQLRETLRRRRAIGGPAEKTFATLVGLELRPRRLREAAELWRRLREEQGVEARDQLWGHPDLLPSGDDLDDIDGFLSRSVGIDMSELEDGDGKPE